MADVTGRMGCSGIGTWTGRVLGRRASDVKGMAGTANGLPSLYTFSLGPDVKKKNNGQKGLCLTGREDVRGRR
jgi:hypothetical protein